MAWGKNHNHEHINKVIDAAPAFALHVALHAIDYAVDPEYAFSKQKTVPEFRSNIQNRFNTTHAELAAVSKVRFDAEMKLYKMLKAKNPNVKNIAAQEQVVVAAQAEYTEKYEPFLDARRAEEITRNVMPAILKVWEGKDAYNGAGYAEDVKQIYRDIILTSLWSTDKPNYMKAEKFISLWLDYPDHFEEDVDIMMGKLENQLLEWHTNQ